MPGVQALASARGHVGTRTNQGSCIDYITEKPYLHHQLGVPRAPISGSPVSAKMSKSYAVVTNDIYPLTSAYWGLGCVFYQPQGSRKNFISPAGLITVTFTRPEIFLLALILMTIFFK